MRKLNVVYFIRRIYTISSHIPIEYEMKKLRASNISSTQAFTHTQIDISNAIKALIGAKDKSLSHSAQIDKLTRNSTSLESEIYTLYHKVWVLVELCCLWAVYLLFVVVVYWHVINIKCITHQTFTIHIHHQIHALVPQRANFWFQVVCIFFSSPYFTLRARDGVELAFYFFIFHSSIETFKLNDFVFVFFSESNTSGRKSHAFSANNQQTPPRFKLNIEMT